MNSHDIIMKNLRDAGFDHDKLADLFSGEDAKPVHVVNVVPDHKTGKVLFVRHTKDTVVVFQGLQVVLDRLTLLIHHDIARDWAL